MFDFIANLLYGFFAGLVCSLAFPIGGQRGCWLSLALSLAVATGLGLLLPTNAGAPILMTTICALIGTGAGQLIRIALDY